MGWPCQCNLLSYEIHDHWVEKVFDARTDTPLDGFVAVTLSQVIQADKKLFLKLAEFIRGGVQVTAAGKPLDLVFDKAMQHPDVLHVLQPMHAPKTVRVEKPDHNRPPGPYEYPRPTNRKGKGKGRGGTGSTTIRMPAGLEDGVPATKGGNPLCFDFNFGKCRLPVTKGRCHKGLHLCCFKNCHKADHYYLTCPLRKQGGA